MREAGRPLLVGCSLKNFRKMQESSALGGGLPGGGAPKRPARQRPAAERWGWRRPLRGCGWNLKVQHEQRRKDPFFPPPRTPSTQEARAGSARGLPSRGRGCIFLKMVPCLALCQEDAPGPGLPAVRSPFASQLRAPSQSRQPPSIGPFSHPTSSLPAPVRAARSVTSFQPLSAW